MYLIVLLLFVNVHDFEQRYLIVYIRNRGGFLIKIFILFHDIQN
jgi:hypothetical protein